jgi:hemolysin III
VPIFRVPGRAIPAPPFDQPPMPDDPSTPRESDQEESANALSHALACVLAFVAMPALAQQVRADEHPLRLAALVAFLGTMALMYLVSSVYHALPVGRAKVRWRRWDHATIFVFIAGSYTPFALAALQRGGSAWLLALVWLLALAGVAAKLTLPLRCDGRSTAVYVGYGLIASTLAQPALDVLPDAGRALFVAGAAAYLIGVAFFLLGHRLRFSHLIWHLCVIGGSACHGCAVLQVVA